MAKFKTYAVPQVVRFLSGSVPDRDWTKDFVATISVVSGTVFVDVNDPPHPLLATRTRRAG